MSPALLSQRGVGAPVASIDPAGAGHPGAIGLPGEHGKEADWGTKVTSRLTLRRVEGLVSRERDRAARPMANSTSGMARSIGAAGADTHFVVAADQAADAGEGAIDGDATDGDDLCCRARSAWGATSPRGCECRLSNQ